MNNQIPQGYKDSALGIIPQEWEVKRLGEIATKIGSGVTPRGGEAVYKTKGHFFIRSQNVGWGHLIIDDVAYIDECTHKKQISTELCVDDVLLNITGASIGRCALATIEVSGGNVNQHVCIIRVNKKDILPFYLSSYLLSEKGQQVIDSYQAGGNRQGLNFEQIKSFVIPMPSLYEQKKIAEILGVWDSAIEKQSALVDALTRRKRALMQQLLTAKKRLPNFTEPWKKVKLKDIFTLKQGIQCAVENQFSTEFENSVRFIRIVDLTSINEPMRFINSPGCEHIIASNDLFMVRYGTPGLVGYGYKGTIANNLFRLMPNVEINSYFYYFVLKNMENMIFKLSGSSTMPALNFGTLNNLYIPQMPLPEQQAIAEILSTADQEIELAKKRLKAFRTQKSALMQQILTGKKRVKYLNYE